MQFKAGDIVRLKSGGPDMTVLWVGTDGSVHCGWFNSVDGTHTPANGSFPPAALKMLTPA